MTRLWFAAISRAVWWRIHAATYRFVILLDVVHFMPPDPLSLPADSDKVVKCDMRFWLSGSQEGAHLGGVVMAWLWVVVVSVVALSLLIAFLVDRRGGTGTGMTDRDRNDAERALRDQVDRSRPWSGDTSIGN